MRENFHTKFAQGYVAAARKTVLARTSAIDQNRNKSDRTTNRSHSVNDFISSLIDVLIN
jgi:hypothetical protein